MLVGNLRLGSWRRAVFIGRGILWIGLGFGVDCLREKSVFYRLCAWGWGFQSLRIVKGRGNGGKVEIGFDMCLCCWWRQVVVGR